MRDQLAPVIEDFDLSGIVIPFSFRCVPFFTEGDNNVTLLDGTSIHDALAAKVRLSWKLYALSSAQYAALTAALNSGESPDTVSAEVFDPTKNAVRRARFHVTRPAFQFALSVGNQLMAYSGSELVLEESGSDT